MKTLFYVSVLSLIGFAIAGSIGYPRGCVYDPFGRCLSECPVGTHSYSTGCGQLTREPTCSKPNPVAEEIELCDYTACYCDSPTIRDTKTKKCVLPKHCTSKE